MNYSPKLYIVTHIEEKLQFSIETRSLNVLQMRVAAPLNGFSWCPHLHANDATWLLNLQIIICSLHGTAMMAATYANKAKLI